MSETAGITKAFLLGAGLGTRLRPLTDSLPKPLIPVFHRPLIHYALDHCLAAGIREFAINTHHLPEKWEEYFPNHSYRGAALTFFNESELLETGGGIKNIEGWIGSDSLLIYNGDILADLDLARLLATHLSSDKTATLAVRSSGPSPHIAVDGDKVCDIRHTLAVAPGSHQFTGIYCINSDLLDRIPSAEKVSIIPAFLELAREARLGASLHEEGRWLDLGTREAYLEAHHRTDLGSSVHPEARIHPEAILEATAAGAGATVGAGAALLNCVLWPGTEVGAGAQLTNCVVYSSTPAVGAHHNADL